MAFSFCVYQYLKIPWSSAKKSPMRSLEQIIAAPSAKMTVNIN
jgi:hypothetical protein